MEPHRPPLGSLANEVLGLTPTQNSILVATPILVGSVGRIPVGALTDRFGGRTMFAVVTLVTIVPVLLVAGAGFRLSFTGLVAAGFLLGIAGTAFAVGIPFVNAWFEPEHRGMATGVFGADMVGTALSAFFTHDSWSGSGTARPTGSSHRAPHNRLGGTGLDD